MTSIIRKICSQSSPGTLCRSFSISAKRDANHTCKLLVIGGGTGGCTMAAKFTRRLGKDSVIVLEPSSDHYYQPLWTLVGAGIKRLRDTHRSEHSVLPGGANWLKDSAIDIDPQKCTVTTAMGDVIHFEYAVIAVGLKNDYEKIPGLSAALNAKDSGVSTIYSADYCEKTWKDMQQFRGGDAIFTYPASVIKCPGAPQKITYLADSFFTRQNIRSKTNISYNTSLPVIFGVKKYADVLVKVAERKNINVNYKTVLKEVRHEKKEAVFSVGDEQGKDMTVGYDMLHVAPPMSAPAFLRDNRHLADPAGYLHVDKYTLQHHIYTNIYGIGDCTNTPNSKTAAAIALQSKIVEKNLLSTMRKSSPSYKYNGYGACPLVTSYNTCILAEFLYDGVVHETFPFDQVTAYESKAAFYMKKDLFPFIYWNLMLKGRYHGPETVRKVMRVFAPK